MSNILWMQTGACSGDTMSRSLRTVPALNNWVCNMA